MTKLFSALAIATIAATSVLAASDANATSMNGKFDAKKFFADLEKVVR